jgi:hypothetical protein
VGTTLDDSGENHRRRPRGAWHVSGQRHRPRLRGEPRASTRSPRDERRKPRNPAEYRLPSQAEDSPAGSVTIGGNCPRLFWQGRRCGGYGVRMATPATADAVHDRRGAAAILRVSPATLARWATRGHGPRYSRTGSRRGRCLYLERDLVRWLESRAVPHGAPTDAR